MTDTPTRAEVEAIIAELRKAKPATWERAAPGSPPRWVSSKAHEAADTLEALLPLAYTETGETWRRLAQSREWWESEKEVYAIMDARPDNAERCLAEVEGELKQMKEDMQMEYEIQQEVTE